MHSEGEVWARWGVENICSEQDDGRTKRRTDGRTDHFRSHAERSPNGTRGVLLLSYFVSNAQAIIPVADGAENDVPFNPSEQDDENEVDV